MANRYVAGASRLPFAVMRGYAGTDLAARTTVRPLTCPFTGEELAAIPALTPDVTVIHAQEADRGGNVQLWGIPGVQKEAVLAARRSLVTVERVVEELTPRPGGVIIPGWVDRRCGGSARWLAAVLQPRDHRARQRLLPGVGRDQPRPRHLHGLDGRARARSGECTLMSPSAPAEVQATPGEMQTIAAARRLRGARSVFIGVGARARRRSWPARSTTRARARLRVRHDRRQADPIPLSIGDGELAETADAVVSVPEMFNYWIGPGRIDVAFLGAAQVDRYANLNSTVIGDYDHPRTRLPGAGGAPEIAASCAEMMVIAPHNPRTFVPELDFRTTVGHGDGPGRRERLGFRGAGPTAVITDLGVARARPRDQGAGDDRAASGSDPR